MQMCWVGAAASPSFSQPPLADLIGFQWRQVWDARTDCEFRAGRERDPKSSVPTTRFELFGAYGATESFRHLRRHAQVSAPTTGLR